MSQAGRTGVSIVSLFHILANGIKTKIHGDIDRAVQQLQVH